MNIILFGPPGAGKGTQSQYLIKKFSCTHLSTGDLIREEIDKGSDLGKTVEGIVKSGGFPQDSDILMLAENFIRDHRSSNGFIFDGFPRTLFQAEALGSLLGTLALNLDLVIELQVDDDVLLERIEARFTCKSCRANYNDELRPLKQPGICDVCKGTEFIRRPDDSVETLKARLKMYHEQTEKLIEYYSEKGLLRKTDGSQSIDDVSARLDVLIGEIMEQKRTEVV